MQGFIRTLLCAFFLCGSYAHASPQTMEEGTPLLPSSSGSSSAAVDTLPMHPRASMLPSYRTFAKNCSCAQLVLDGIGISLGTALPLIMGEEVSRFGLSPVSFFFVLPFIGVALFEDLARREDRARAAHPYSDWALIVSETLINIARVMKLLTWTGPPDIWCVQYFILAAASYSMAVSHFR